MQNNTMIWIDSIDFENKGGWKIDTQFVHLMGCGYLIAADEPEFPSPMQQPRLISPIKTNIASGYVTDTIAKSNLKIFHGKYDSVVPVRHSIDLYNAIIDKYPSASVYLDIFDGGHEIDMQTAVYWIMSQYTKKNKILITG